MDMRPLGGSRSCEPPGVTPPHGSHCGCHLRPHGASPPAAKWQHPRGALGVPGGTGSPLGCSDGSGVGARPTAAPPPPGAASPPCQPKHRLCPPGGWIPPQRQDGAAFWVCTPSSSPPPRCSWPCRLIPCIGRGGRTGDPPHDCPPPLRAGLAPGPRLRRALACSPLLYSHPKENHGKKTIGPKTQGVGDEPERGPAPPRLKSRTVPPLGGLTPGVVAPGRRLCPRRALSMDLFQPRLFSPRGPGGRSAL